MGSRRRGHVFLPLFLPTLEGLSPVVRARPGGLGSASGAALVGLAPTNPHTTVYNDDTATVVPPVLPVLHVLPARRRLGYLLSVHVRAGCGHGHG